MNCKVARQCLSAYIDRELTGAEMLLVRTHLYECEKCAREETELRTLKNLLSGMPSVEPPIGLEAKLLTSMATEKRSKSQLSSVALVATLAAAAAVTAFLITPAPSQPMAARPIAPVKRDIAFEIGRDQVFAAGSDPLSGGHAILASDSYGRH